jgi:hypothetical protein
VSALSVFLALWAATQTPPPPISVAEYGATLDRLIAATKDFPARPERAPSVIAEIPIEWQVRAGERTFTIPMEPLRRELRQWSGNHDAAILARVSDTLRMLRSDAMSFERPPADVSRDRELLTGILSAREFRGVHGPTAFDYLRQRIRRFLLRLLGRALGSSAIPAISAIFVDILIVLAVLMLALTIYRVIRRAAAHETPIPVAFQPASQEWTGWLAQARAAADSGSWRDAIHFAYWCGISFLEAQGVWRPDGARTPREYLQLLPQANEHRQTLAALTRGFERVWYGTDTAHADAYAAALGELRKLGCPST